MKKEIKVYSTVCDCCETDLGTNVDKPHVIVGAIDLCFDCAGQIFERELSEKVPEDKLLLWIKELRKANKPLLDNPFKDDNPSDVYISRPEMDPRDYPTQTFRTTGINEMVPITATEDERNNMFKVHPSNISNSVSNLDSTNLTQKLTSVSDLKEVRSLDEL